MGCNAPTRRVVQLRVHPELLFGMHFPSFPGSWNRTDRGLPEGAKMVGCGCDWERNCFYMIAEHPSFAEVPMGEIPPVFMGIELSAMHVSNPVDAASIDMLNRLSDEQIKRAEDAEDARRRRDLENGAILVTDYFKICRQQPPDDPQPLIAPG